MHDLPRGLEQRTERLTEERARPCAGGHGHLAGTDGRVVRGDRKPTSIGYDGPDLAIKLERRTEALRQL